MGAADVSPHRLDGSDPIAVPADANLASDFFALAAAEPDRTCLLRRTTPGEPWAVVTRTAFAAEVTAVARGLVASGLRPGDRLGLMSHTRYEWTLLDYAAWSAGLVVVPLYETSSPEQVEWVAGDADLAAIVVETPAHAATVAAVTPQLRSFAIDAGAIDVLVAAGGSVADSTVEGRRAALTSGDIATIIYTSGTTARSKGCALTHRNLLFEIESVVSVLQPLFTDDSATLLFLPAAHVLGRIMQCATLRAGVALGHTSDLTTLASDLEQFRPTFLLTVPRMLEKVYAGARFKARSGGSASRRIFDAADATAIAFSQALDTGRVPFRLAARHRLFDALVYRKIRAALGGRCTAAIAGGAPLPTSVGHFFRGVGLEVFEGYGLTETTAAACVNAYGAAKFGTVGRSIPGVEVRTAEDGELLVRGGVVFDGYWNDAAATAAAIVDGWLHTGDLGSIDNDGFVSVTGRKKEIIVTAAGKNVSPAVLEDRLASHPLVATCMVVGDRRPFVGALITLDRDAVSQWLTEHHRPADEPVESLVTDTDLLADLQAAVDRANAAVSRAESIRKFVVLPLEFTEAGGELTPSLKLKRRVVLDRYADVVKELYVDARPPTATRGD